MNKNVSIVKVDKRSYRKIAQENWGLTNEQMQGMHVHHRVPRSKGGTNDPSNLFVCSPWFHAYVWHDKSFFVEWSYQIGMDNKILGRGIFSPEFLHSDRKREICKAQGKKTVDNRVGILDPLYLSSPKKVEDSTNAGRIGGAVNARNGTGICNPKYYESERAKEIRRQNGIKTGPTAAATTNAQLWRSTVDGFEGRACSVARHNKARGWDPAARVRIK